MCIRDRPAGGRPRSLLDRRLRNHPLRSPGSLDPAFYGKGPIAEQLLQNLGIVQTPQRRDGFRRRKGVQDVYKRQRLGIVILSNFAFLLHSEMHSFRDSEFMNIFSSEKEKERF